MNSPSPPLKALLAYTAITVVFSYPLILQLGSVVPNDLGDPLLNAWILWWNSQKLPLTADWWSAPAFFPLRDALALSEHLLGLSPLTSPVIWLSGNPLLAYNTAFLLTFVLSAMSAYALGATVTGRHDAAFVAGLAYAFSPYRMAQLAHIQVLAAFWMPLALAALHRYLEDRRPRWLALFAAATALQGLTNGYYLLFFPVLVAFWVLWFAPPGRRIATAGAVGGSLAAGFLLLLPFLLRYRAVHEQLRLGRQLEEITRFSAGIDDLLRTGSGLELWGRLLETSYLEVQLFPGLTCVFLVVAALAWVNGRSGPDEAGAGTLPPPVRLGLAVVASLLSVVALSRLILGPWRLELLGLAISTGKLSKPVTQAFYTWMIVALTGPFTRQLFRSRSPLVFYSLGTVVMWLFSFGPAPRIGDVELLYWAPYRWLTLLPGFDSLRVPARFAMLAVLCLSIAAALALVRLRRRVGRRAGILLVTLVVAGIVAEGWRRVPLLDPPAPSILSAADGPGAVLELPLGIPARDGQAMYRGTAHRRPVVNGYSGYEPANYIVLRLALPRREPEVLRELAIRGVRHVVVFHDRDRGRQWRRYVRSYPGATHVRTSGGQTLFSLSPPNAPSPGVCDGPALPVIRLEASVLPDRIAEAFDGSPDTRWDTGRPQAPGDRILVDLGAIAVVTGVELALGPYCSDFPRKLAIEASLDGADWTRLWRGPTSAKAYAAAIDAPRRMPLRVCFPSARARYLRLRQLSREPVFRWTVAELVVLGAADDAPNR